MGRSSNHENKVASIEIVFVIAAALRKIVAHGVCAQFLKRRGGMYPDQAR